MLMFLFLRIDWSVCFLRRYDSLILLLIRFLSVACLNPFFGTLMAIRAGEDRGSDNIIQTTLNKGLRNEFPFSNSSSIRLFLQSLSSLENVCLSPFSISESDFPGMSRKMVPDREAGTEKNLFAVSVKILQVLIESHGH